MTVRYTFGAIDGVEYRDVTHAWTDSWLAAHNNAVDAHVRAELERLGIPEEEAVARVVLVWRRLSPAHPWTGMPEVWLREDWERVQRAQEVPVEHDTAMTGDDVWEAIVPVHGALIRSALTTLAFIPKQALVDAINRIEHEATWGPMTNPTWYLDGRRFRNAEQYQELLRLLVKVRAMLVKEP